MSSEEQVSAFKRFIEDEVLPQGEGLSFVPVNMERLEAWMEANPDASAEEIRRALNDPQHHLYPEGDGEAE